MDCTYSGNPTKSLNLAGLLRAKELLDKAEYIEPFAEYMKQEGYDYKEDYMLISENVLKELSLSLPHLSELPSYVKVSAHIKGIMLMRGLYSGFLKKPVGLNMEARIMEVL